MKLRNKKTGDIVELVELTGYFSWFNKTDAFIEKCNSLAELDEEWEDYEEPKNFWFIDEYYAVCGTMASEYDPDRWRYDEYHINKLKRIGNYFETKEEAEKAVEKLKAWKRLEDDGFRFNGWTNDIGDKYYQTGDIVIALDYDDVALDMCEDDLDLLFGGENE